MEISKVSDVQHILLTSLGVQALEATYQWRGQTKTARLTPLALVQLLEPSQRPNRVVAVVTDKAKEQVWPIFQQGIREALGFEPDPPIYIPDGRNSDEISQILELVAQRFPKDGAELTLDITQGLRHFPFMVYALVLYLTSLRGVKVRGAYYGMLEGAPREAPKPIIDLQPLLELPEWFHAVRIFQDQGTTLPMARLIRPLEERLKQEARQLQTASDTAAVTPDKRQEQEPRAMSRYQQAAQVKRAVDVMEQHAFAYESALPLELGRASRLLIDPIQKLIETPFARNLPLAQELAEAIIGAADQTSFKSQVSSRGKWKTTVSLDETELDRQSRMIDQYLDRRQLPLAVGLMREWVVSWCMWKLGKTDRWLDAGTRRPFEQRLRALGELARNPIFPDMVTPSQQAFGGFWNHLTVELRNALHHHAMREDAITRPPDALVSVRCFWEQLKLGAIDLPSLGGGAGRLLISAQGTRPGVLFSALNLAQPQRCLVICSPISARSIPEAAKQAAFDGPLESIELTDPHGGFAEIKPAVRQAWRWLLDADEVVASVTGGTTLMGLIVQQLAEEAQKLDRPVRRFALIDRRPPAQQDAEPFVQGDCHWIDPQNA